MLIIFWSDSTYFSLLPVGYVTYFSLSIPLSSWSIFCFIYLDSISLYFHYVLSFLTFCSPSVYSDWIQRFTLLRSLYTSCSFLFVFLFFISFLFFSLSDIFLLSVHFYILTFSAHLSFFWSNFIYSIFDYRFLHFCYPNTFLPPFPRLLQIYRWSNDFSDTIFQYIYPRLSPGTYSTVFIWLQNSLSNQ